MRKYSEITILCLVKIFLHLIEDIENCFLEIYSKAVKINYPDHIKQSNWFWFH